MTTRVQSPPSAIASRGSTNRGPLSEIDTPALIEEMRRVSTDVTDLVFSPGRLPQVKLNGLLRSVPIERIGVLVPADTARIAQDLIGHNASAGLRLRDEGSCDISYGLERVGRFRVNIFLQRGTHAIIMRVISHEIPTFEKLQLPAQLADCADLARGIILVTGPAGSGKSSTLAAILDRINEKKEFHIVTIEDPIEFLHNHKKSTVHQRELSSDAPTFAQALRAALRQAPNVILIGELRERETIALALEAAEAGYLVLSSLNTGDASKSVEAIVSAFKPEERLAIRASLASNFRYIISQRLIQRKDGNGRIAVFEILLPTAHSRDYIERGESKGRTLADAIREGAREGMQSFNHDIERLVRDGIIRLTDDLQ